MTPDDGSTERCENSCVGAYGDGRYEYDHVWSRGRTDIRFGRRYDVSDGAILKIREGGPSQDTFQELGFGRVDGIPKNPSAREVPSRRL